MTHFIIPLTIIGLFVVLISIWISKLFKLRGQIPSYSDYWSVPRGETGGIIYLALGDSAAQGIGASRPDKGYVGIIADQIRKRTHQPVQVINISKSGAKIQDVIEHQISQIEKYNPDIITVDIGGNDISAYSKERLRTGITTLCDQLPIGTIIADVPYFMHGHWERNSLEASEFIADIAQKHNLSVAHVHSAMKARGFKSMLYDFAADWFHPNNKGHRVWSSAFEKPIDEQISVLLKNKKR